LFGSKIGPIYTDVKEYFFEELEIRSFLDKPCSLSNAAFQADLVKQ